MPIKRRERLFVTTFCQIKGNVVTLSVFFVAHPPSKGLRNSMVVNAIQHLRDEQFSGILVGRGAERCDEKVDFVSSHQFVIGIGRIEVPGYTLREALDAAMRATRKPN